MVLSPLWNQKKSVRKRSRVSQALKSPRILVTAAEIMTRTLETEVHEEDLPVMIVIAETEHKRI